MAGLGVFAPVTVILDRLNAAQAIARDATLTTRNGRDFRRIEKLRLVEWEPLSEGD